jgi:putative transposase
MGTKHEVYVHLVWATRERAPILRGEIETEIYRAIETKCLDLRCPPRAIGGTSDHVHLLARLHPSVSVARLVAEVKGFSSHAVSRFRWQRGYGVFSVSRDDLPALESYIRNQKRHHELQAIESELEPIDDR